MIVTNNIVDVITPIKDENIININPANKMNNASAPLVIAGRKRYSPMIICSITFACISTPGLNGRKGVLRRSFKPSALAPSKTILPLTARLASCSY